MKVLRSRIHGPPVDLTSATLSQLRQTSGEDGKNGADSSKLNAIVPLARLMLRGNNITDAGVLALVPLVEACATLQEVDLRGNAIGAEGTLALHKVNVPWLKQRSPRTMK